MRILRIIDTLDPRTGGPGAALRALTPMLQRLGHETVVVTLDPPSTPHRRLPGGKVVPLGPALGSYRFARSLESWLEKHIAWFDAVIVHGLWQYPGPCVRRVAVRHGVPYYVYPHGMLDPWFRRAHPGRHLKKWLYWQFAERHVLRDAEAVLFTCEEERRLARGTFAPYLCAERVVAYGSAELPDDVQAQDDAWFSAHPELRARPYWLFLGRIHGKKGLDLLLHAWLEQETAQPGGPALVIAGPAEDAELERRLREKAAATEAGRSVIWAGLVTGPAKWGALRHAEAMVLPSHQENFGVAVAESLAAGTPVLLSNRVNIWREITQDGAGFVRPDDAAGTAALLAAWRRLSVREREAMRDKARRCHARRFRLEAVAHSFLKTIRCAGAPLRQAS